MKNLFLIKKRLTRKMINSVKVISYNEKEKHQVIETVRQLKYSYYMLPINKINFVNIALMLNEVKSMKQWKKR